MTGYELRLWRKGLGWDQEQAAAALDVCVRSYKTYEKSPKISRVLELATQSLSLKAFWPELKNRDLQHTLSRLSTLL